MLISRGCPWASMKRGGCKFGGSKTGAVLCPKRVSQLVPKLKESVTPLGVEDSGPGSWREGVESGKGAVIDRLCSTSSAGRLSPW